MKIKNIFICIPLKIHHILGNWLEHATGPQTSQGQDQGYIEFQDLTASSHNILTGWGWGAG